MSESQIKVELLDSMGDDLSVVNAARVSFDKKSEYEVVDYEDVGEAGGRYKLDLSERDKKLINYLATHKHFSPFGHCFASFRVTAPVFVVRQLGKHEYLRMNEVSRRYVDTPPEFYTPDVWRGRAKDKKQGSEGEFVAQCTMDEEYRRLLHSFMDVYRWAIEEGMAPEQARMILPQSMMTSWWWSGSLDAFANMCNLRLKPDAQYETRLVAEQISKFMSDIYPYSWKALVSEAT